MKIINFTKLKSIISSRSFSYSSKKTTKVVAQIIEDIRKNGDKSVLKYVKKFENQYASYDNLVIPQKRLKESYKKITKDQKEILKLAYKRIYNYHKKQTKPDQKFKDDLDTSFKVKWTPISNVGLYIPGGKASYPSSVLMTAIPAKIAKVDNVMMTVPSANGEVSNLTLAAAYLCKVNKVFNIGGAHAIAAFAFGTKLIKKADKVFGPGNKYVAEAKKQLFGTIGIDLPAGPSEILVLADSKSNPKWIAADILAQAEHDPNAKTYLISTSIDIIKASIKNINEIQKINKFKNVHHSIKKFSYAILAKDKQEMFDISNFIAPEHLHVHLKNTKNIEKYITNAGSVFVGGENAVALGDYSIGTNHVLPTDQSARYSSGLSVDDFVKKTVFINTGKKTFDKIASKTIKFAKSEGLDAHALSIEIRSSRS